MSTADEIRREGKQVDIEQTLADIDELLYALNNGVRQQKRFIGIDTLMISEVILATRTQLNVIHCLLHPSVE